MRYIRDDEEVILTVEELFSLYRELQPRNASSISRNNLQQFICKFFKTEYPAWYKAKDKEILRGVSEFLSDPIYHKEFELVEKLLEEHKKQERIIEEKFLHDTKKQRKKYNKALDSLDAEFDDCDCKDEDEEGYDLYSDFEESIKKQTSLKNTQLKKLKKVLTTKISKMKYADKFLKRI